jgi:hypothetical protein
VESMKGIFSQVRPVIADELKTEPVEFVPAKTGVSFVDQLSVTVAHGVWRNLHTAWKMDDQIRKLDAESVLLPVNLVTPEGVAKGRFIVEEAQGMLTAMMKELESNNQAFIDTVLAIDMPDKAAFMRGIRRANESGMASNLRFVENQRAILDVSSRILAFADSKAGTMTVKNGKLIVKTDEDLQAYNDLIAEMGVVLKGSDAIHDTVLRKVDALANGNLKDVR